MRQILLDKIAQKEDIHGRRGSEKEKIWKESDEGG